MYCSSTLVPVAHPAMLSDIFRSRRNLAEGLPMVVLIPAVARVSLRFGGDDDCLGYTAFARRAT
jgi:hypothetical protein